MRLDGQRIAVYCRYSTDRQSDRSIDDQLRLCREYVERYGGRIDPSLVFSDAALSGAGESMLRPGFQALHHAVRDRLIDVVVTEDITRIGRSVEINARTMRQFKSWGARLLSVHDSADLSDDGSLVLTTVKSLMAEQYVKELRKRTKRGMDGLHLAGMHTGGRVYGYRSVAMGDGSTRKRLEVDEQQAAIVRRVFAEFVAGTAVRVIAERLNRAGHESPRGGKWSHLTLRAMLRNETYVGRVVYNRRQWERDHDSGKRSKVERPRSEWRTTDHAELRIVDAETWDATCVRIRATERTYKQGARPKQGFALSGLLACGLCGQAMIVHGEGRYYACGGRKKGTGCENSVSLRESAVRSWVIDKIRDTAGSSAMLEQMRARWAADTGARDREMRAELAERKTALARTVAQSSRLLDFIADGKATPAVESKLREKDDHAELQRAAIAGIESALGRVPVLPSLDELRGFLRALPEVVAERPDRARALIARLIVGLIKCFPPAERLGDYRIRFDLVPSALMKTTEPAPVGSDAGSARGSCGGAILPLADVVPIDGLCPRNYAELSGK